MQTYVYSLRPRARLAHIGTANATLCGVIYGSAYTVSGTVPADRELCGRCAGLDDDRSVIVARRAEVVRARDARFVALLKEGLDNTGMIRRTGFAQRTVVRYVNGAMYRAGAKTRFQWGYMVGLAEGRRTR